MRSGRALLLAAVASALAACGRPAPPAAPSPEPPALAVAESDVLVDADAVPALFTAVRGARTRLRGAAPAFTPRIAAAWADEVAAARARGVAVDLAAPVEGGAAAVLVADTTVMLVRCDLAGGGRGVTLLLSGDGLADSLAARPWWGRSEGIVFHGTWPELAGIEAAIAPAAVPDVVVRAARASSGARLLVGHGEGVPDLGAAEVRRGPDAPGFAGVLVITKEAAYLDLAPGVLEVRDAMLLLPLRAHFDEVLWPSAEAPADVFEE